ncbi:ATP-dependent zinc protease [Candidatus Saccharibacteria bacterium]|nr:ATP-dependent zinc protease [Candidatus Saccharibacteria bacterium]MBP5656470.1 ATP-dependent zinc protease [Candidatus Saccharibacteria bacterium]
MSQKTVIGRDAEVSFVGLVDNVPAKVDTGADASAVWASDIFVDKDGKLHFKLFDDSSPYYTGEEITTDDYSVAMVKSASGDTVMKYKVKLSIRIKGKRIGAVFGLSDRSTHNYPILIGRRTLQGKFIVDVEEKVTDVEKDVKNTPRLNVQMREDPYKFYKEQYLNGVDEK